MNAILVPTDFSFGASKALDYAIPVARAKQVPIVLLHVCELPGFGLEDMEILAHEYNEEQVRRLLERLHLLKSSIESTEQIKVEVKLYNGSFTGSVAQVIKEQHISLVIIGTIGEGRSISSVFGSKAAALIRQALVPVLAVPPQYETAAYKSVILAIKEEDGIPHEFDLVLEFVALLHASLEVLTSTDNDEEAYQVMHDTRVLHRFIDEVKLRYPAVKLEWTHLNGNHFEQVLFQHLKDHPCDLLVMVAYHRHWMQYLTGASATQRLVMHSYIPLLVIPSFSFSG